MFEAHARALFAAERKESACERERERDARKTFTMREQQKLLLFRFHFDDETTEGGFCSRKKKNNA